MCVILAFVGCLFVVKPGFENAHLIPALIGVCGGLGAGIAYTMVRKMGTHGVKGPVIVFYFSCFSCIIVIPWIVFHYQPMSLRQLLTLFLAGLFAAGGQFTIIFATLLGFLLFAEIPDRYSLIGYGLIILASLGNFLYNWKHKD